MALNSLLDVFWLVMIRCYDLCPNEKKYCNSGVEIPESLTKFSMNRGSAAKRTGRSSESLTANPVEMAREKFQIAAKAGCDLGFKWLERLEEEEKRLLTERQSD